MASASEVAPAADLPPRTLDESELRLLFGTKAAIFLGASYFVLLCLQIIAFGRGAGSGFVDADAARLSVGVNLFLVAVAAGFYGNVRLGPWLRFDHTAHLALVVIVLAIVVHGHLAGSQGTLIAMSIVPMALCAQRVLGIRAARVYTAVAVTLYLALALAEKQGWLGYAPLFVAGDRLRDPFLDGRYIAGNLIILLVNVLWLLPVFERELTTRRALSRAGNAYVERLEQTGRELEIGRQRLREVTAELALAEERERRRIAADLHDRVVQTLALAKLELGQLVEDLDARERAATLTEHVDRAMGEVREVLLDLSPPMLYELGLGAALEWLAERQTERHGIPFELAQHGSERALRDDAKVFLYQAMRELSLNAAKHADASRVSLGLEWEDHGVSVTIEDDGRGFLPSEGRGDADGRFGLFSLRERAELAGGRMVLASEPGMGTRARVSLPYSRAMMEDDS